MRRMVQATPAFLCAFVGMSAVHGQVRTYDVQWVDTGSAPTVDGVLSPGEWDAVTGVSGNFSMLRENDPDTGEETPDADNNALRMLWTTDGLYIAHTTDKAVWTDPPQLADPPGFNNLNFGLDNNNFYFDPNLDGEDNIVPNNEVDGYQIAFQNGLGNQRFENGTGMGLFQEAHVNSPFGNQGGWGGLRDFGVVAEENNGALGGVFEVFFPWEIFNASAGGALGDGDGLNHPFSPINDDTWIFEFGYINNADTSNFLPVWNNNGVASFAIRSPNGHGEINFIGSPTVEIARYDLPSVDGVTDRSSSDSEPNTVAGDITGGADGSIALAGEIFNDTSEADAFANGNFLEFTVTPDDDTTMSLERLSFDISFESENAVFQWALRADDGVDAFSTLIGEGFFGGFGDDETVRIDLRDAAFLQDLSGSATLRLALFDALDDTDNDAFITNVTLLGLVNSDSPLVLGDLNGDGVLDAFDVAPFEQALADKDAFIAANPDIDPDLVGDFNDDGVLDAFDVAGFEAALAGGAAVPEPASLALLGLGGLAMLRRHRH